MTKNKNAYLKEVSDADNSDKVIKMKEIKDLLKQPNEKTRALMANAILEDEAISLASQERSRVYLNEKEEDDRIPMWAWCLMYFFLGILFMISVDNVFWHWKDFIIG